MSISGKTAVCFTLASPVKHVRTPAAFNALAARAGADIVMVPLEVGADDLAPFLAAMRRMANVNGAVITIPHKGPAARLCDELSARARQCEAVNVVRRTPDGRLVGDMFDGLGFVEGLKRAGHEPAGRSVLLCGAGGAARAIAFALADAGVARLAVSNRTASRAQSLVEGLARAFPQLAVAAAPADAAGFDMVVNATALGMAADDPLPLDLAGLARGALVAEAVMAPERTALLAAAAAAGARTHPGRAMLEAQLELIAGFLGVAADSAATQHFGYNQVRN